MADLREPWQALGACASVGCAPFFVCGETPVARTVEQYCSRCLVVDECLAYGVKHGMVGVWGGRLLERGKGMKRARHRKVDLVSLVEACNAEIPTDLTDLNVMVEELLE